MIREDLRGLKAPAAEPLSVAMWTVPQCTACMQTYRRLCAAGVPVSVLPLAQSPEVAEFAAEAELTSAPVVLGIRPDGSSVWWCGLDASRIAEFIGLARKERDRV